MDNLTVGWWASLGAFAFVFFFFSLALVYVTFEKGKKGFGWLGILGFLFPVLLVFPLIGASRIAKPSSDFATDNYHEGKMGVAVERFPDDPGPRPDWMRHHITFGE